MSDCKFLYPGTRFDGLSGSLPDPDYAHYDREVYEIELHLFQELRSKFIRTKREWPLCPLHGAVKLSCFTMRSKIRRTTEVEMIFGCEKLHEGDDFVDLDAMVPAGQSSSGICLDDFFAPDLKP